MDCAVKNSHITAALVLVSLATANSFAWGKETAPNGQFKIAGKTSRAIQKYTGLTWIGNRVASMGAGLALKSKLGGKVKVKARSYSFTDMLQGKFESVEVKLTDSKLKGIPFGTVHAKTDQPVHIRYFKKNGEKPGVVSPVMVSLRGSVNEEQVTRALNAKEIANALRFLKLDLPGLGEQHLQILDPEVLLEKDKITLKAWMVTKNAPRESGVPLAIVATPVLDGDRFIILKETKINSTAIENPELFANFAEELLNPLFDFGRLDRQTRAFRVQKLNLDDKQVSFDGKLLLAPKPKPAPATPPATTTTPAPHTTTSSPPAGAKTEGSTAQPSNQSSKDNAPAAPQDNKQVSENKN
jgi:hypothetical protein